MNRRQLILQELEESWISDKCLGKQAARPLINRDRFGMTNQAVVLIKLEFLIDCIPLEQRQSLT